ncbi:chromatin associated protein KTI12 [Terfezia claveryi]|nr:chromatin associated protein KTI12 [Terfezia claveryi]
MPLIILTGYPCSGKTTRALELRDFFIERIAAAQAAQKTGLSVPSTPQRCSSTDDLRSTTTAINTTIHPNPPFDPSETARISCLKVHLINIDSLHIPRTSYRDARSEKESRSTEYSAIKRHLSRDNIVISDSLNYIKGYRYQLYCEAKALLTPSCVVHIASPPEKCRLWNSSRNASHAPDPHSPAPPGSSLPPPDVMMCILPVEGEAHKKQLTAATPAWEEDILENLIFRYEEPNGMTRWDSPLFTVPWVDERMDCEAIWDAVVGKEAGAKIKANVATIIKPATEADYLHELDKTTQEIVSLILEAQRNGMVGGELTVPDCKEVLNLPPTTVSLPQLQRIRRQYISLNRHHAQAKSRIKELFVGYLNTNV